jgi:hypothetical protein
MCVCSHIQRQHTLPPAAGNPVRGPPYMDAYMQAGRPSDRPPDTHTDRPSDTYTGAVRPLHHARPAGAYIPHIAAYIETEFRALL